MVLSFFLLIFLYCLPCLRWATVIKVIVKSVSVYGSKLNHTSLLASQISFQSDIHVGHTVVELLASWKMNRRSILVASSSRMHFFTHRCVHSKRRAGETSNARWRRTLQGELPGPGWLVNKPAQFGIACHEIPFIWLTRERMQVSRIHALLCTRVHVQHACGYLYAQSTYANMLDTPASY